MSVPRLLEGVVEPDADHEATVASLRAELRGLRAELAEARATADTARQDALGATRAIARLRRQLDPLYTALQAVFGEIEAGGVTESQPPYAVAGGPASAGVDARVASVWEAWKSRLPPACGKVIDALLTHGELTQAQLKVAARLGTSTVSDAIYKLNKAGLINKNGGRVSLKAL